jgi:hypothetical protein
VSEVYEAIVATCAQTRRDWHRREKTRGVRNRKKEYQESLQPEEGRPGDSRTGRGKTRGVWNRKREDKEGLEPEEGRLGESGTGREKTRRVWNQKGEN